MYHEYFPEEFIQLQLEIEHHPLLVQRLQKHTGRNMTMEIVFAECCHYCGYAIDAELDVEQLIALADRLIWLLRNMAVKSAIVGLSDNWEKESWKFGVH